MKRTPESATPHLDRLAAKNIRASLSRDSRLFAVSTVPISAEDDAWIRLNRVRIATEILAVDFARTALADARSFIRSNPSPTQESP